MTMKQKQIQTKKIIKIESLKGENRREIKSTYRGET